MAIATSNALKVPTKYDEVPSESHDQKSTAGKSESQKPTAMYDEVPKEEVPRVAGEAHTQTQGVYDLLTEPHDYINQQDTAEQEIDSGYHLLEDVSMSPSGTHQFGGSIHSEHAITPPSSTDGPTLTPQPSNGHIHSQKAKTLQVQAPMGYETPLDEVMRSRTIPANFQGNLEDYETPLDAKSVENYETPQDASLI